MAEDSGKPRSVFGPRPLSQLIPALTRPAFKRRSPAGAQLMADWVAAVGPALAGVTTPKRLSGTTLTIGCTGPVALELSHLAPELIGRINAQFGRPVVQQLRFVQQAAPPAHGGPRAAPSPAAPLPPRIEAAMARLPEGELRAALAKLARGVYRTRS